MKINRLKKFCAKPRIGKLFLLGLGLFVSVFLFLPSKAEAAWNPSQIISDDEFLASRTMNEVEIQNFLIYKNSYLANYYETRDTAVGPNNNINTKGWRASAIIWWASQWYGVNPKVILSTLQKEQSLITTSYLNQYGIDWAMGYGVPDGASRDYSKIGFATKLIGQHGNYVLTLKGVAGTSDGGRESFTTIRSGWWVM